MGADSTAGGGSDGLEHQALIYGSTGELVDAAAPLVRAALARGDVAFVATRGENVAALREELGDDAGSVHLHDTEEWCAKPYDRLQAVRRLVSEVPSGRRALAFGEPLWDGSDAARRDWARYESIINYALADAPLRFVCLYDGARLGERELEYAVCTHPEQVADGESVDCARFEPPETFLPGRVPAPPAATPSIPVAEVARLRGELTQAAAAAGLAAPRVDDVVLAANEVATNALVHGAAPVRAYVWREDDALVVRIDDDGSGVADPLAGWLPPPQPADGGWGLVLARQLADTVEIAHGADGAAVVLHFALDA